MWWILVSVLLVAQAGTLFAFFRLRAKHRELTAGADNLEELYAFRKQLQRMGGGLLRVENVDPARYQLWEMSPKG